MTKHPSITETRIVFRTILIAGVLAVLVLAVAGVGAGAELHVYPGDGTPIQDAIDGAGAGDTIYVHAGTYVENVDVDKRVTLIGDGADVVTVRAADVWDHVFEVIASWVNISGFAIKGATRNAGIYLNGADHCNIYENNCSNNNDGIYLYSSSNNTLTENDCSDSHHSIYLHSSSNHNTLNENNCSNNTYGVILYSSSNYNKLTKNDCSYNQCGIFLGYYSSHNTLIENNCSDNYWYGIYMSSNHNTLYHNNLVNNTNYNAYDYSGINQWDSGSAGNYYSDYNGTDNYTDGIGDDPHPIPGGTGTDRFPLMQPWSDTPQKGDLNSDGIITPADAAIALHLAATGAQNPAADVSGDDRVTSLDALMILQTAAGRIEL